MLRHRCLPGSRHLLLGTRRHIGRPPVQRLRSIGGASRPHPIGNSAIDPRYRPDPVPVSTGPRNPRPRISTGPRRYRPDLRVRDTRYRPDLHGYRPELGAETPDIDRSPLGPFFGAWGDIGAGGIRAWGDIGVGRFEPGAISGSDDSSLGRYRGRRFRLALREDAWSYSVRGAERRDAGLETGVPSSRAVRAAGDSRSQPSGRGGGSGLRRAPHRAQRVPAEASAPSRRVTRAGQRCLVSALPIQVAAVRSLR